MTCKHNWNFVDGLTKRIRCTRCAEMRFVNPPEADPRVEEKAREAWADALDDLRMEGKML
jgi:hypothetical protein